jgi:tripartite motif-containing protein 71
MLSAYRFGWVLLVACVVSIWSAPVLGDAPPDPSADSIDATNWLPGPFVSAPDSVGVVNAGYRSMHFESSVGGFVFPFHVTVDNDYFFFSDYSAGTVLMYQIIGGGANYIRTFGAPGSAAGQFSGPAQVAVVGNFIYVADYFNNRVQRFDKTTGAYVSQFGIAGSSPGQLSGPSGLIYNPINSLLYVSETGNDRVQAFSTAGVYQFSFGAVGSGNGQLNNPFGLAVDSVGNVYVADTTNNRVSKFDSTGLWLRHIAVGATSPYAVALDKADHVWVTFGPGDVYSYDSVGGFAIYYYGNYGGVTAPADGYLLQVRGVAVTAPLNFAPYYGSPAIIIADGGSQTVQLFSHAAQPIAHPAIDGIVGLGSYNNGIAFDSAENVYITSYNANTVYKFDKFGAPITQWGSTGTGNGQFSGLMGIAVDDSNNVYVADRNNNRIQKFDSNGGYLTQWGTLGTGDGQFNHPAGVATDGSWLYVTEENNHRVQKFSLSGGYVRKWGSTGTGNGQFSSPEGIAVDRRRNQVYVAEYTGARIQQFTVFGDFIKILADSTSGSGMLAGSLGLAIDQRSNVYASDLANNRIVQFTDNGTYLTNFPALSANGIGVDSRSGHLLVGTLSGGTVSRFGTVSGKTDTIGVYRPSTLTFYLRNGLTAGAPDITATVTGAVSTDIPIVGDWNGDGIDTPGLWRPSTSTFYLWDKWRGLDMATAPYQFVFGVNGDKPIVGDWDGDGRDGVGTFRPSNNTQYLKNKLIAGSPDYSVIFGLAGDAPLGGDWDQDGDSSAGVYRPSTGAFYLTNRNTTGSAPTNAMSALHGVAGDLPVAGDWNHNGSSGVGLFRAGTFYILPNNGAPDGTIFRSDFEAPAITTFAFGLTGDIPLGGTWGQPPE